MLRCFCTFWCSILFSGQRKFVIFCCNTRMNLWFRGCPVVLDIEVSVTAWHHKTRRVLLRAGRLLLVLLLTAESKEYPFAVCGITFKLASNGAEQNDDFVPIRTPRNSAAPETLPLEKKIFSSRNINTPQPVDLTPIPQLLPYMQSFFSFGQHVIYQTLQRRYKITGSST